MTQRRPRAWSLVGGLGALIIGCTITALVFGTHILPTGSTGWMLSGGIGPDPVQYWLGWTFYRQAPWSWPPGLNPGWGLELSASVFYADAIPLLAMGFKALRPLFQVGQYWGLWLYACAALQAFLAWRLVGLATPAPLARLAAAALFVLQPMLLVRMGGHFALSAHFLLLAGLWLCLTRQQPWPRRLAWAGLVLAAALIHAYLLPMVAALWLADLLGRWGRPGHAPWPGLALEAVLVPACGVLGLWSAGFFLLQGGFGGSWGGYGRMQLDLLAPLDPSGWGRLLPRLPGPTHLETQSFYLGLGSILLLLAGALARAWRPGGLMWRLVWRRWWPLLLVLGAMAAFALTNHLTIAGREFVLFELPAPVQRYADALRASGRFIWPLVYALLLGAIFALVQALGGRRTGLLLSLLVLVQVADLQPGLAALRTFFAPQPATLPLRLNEPFWAEAARHYGRIRLVPNANQAPGWEEVAVFAATMGLETDAVYLARLDPGRLAALNAGSTERLRTGAYEAGTLYVLTDAAMLAMAQARHNPGRDLLARFNGLWVLAPGWPQRPPK